MRAIALLALIAGCGDVTIKWEPCSVTDCPPSDMAATADLASPHGALYGECGDPRWPCCSDGGLHCSFDVEADGGLRDGCHPEYELPRGVCVGPVATWH